MNHNYLCATLYKQFQNHIYNEIKRSNSKLYQEINKYEKRYKETDKYIDNYEIYYDGIKELNRAQHIIKEGDVIQDEKINSLITELDSNRCSISKLNRFLSLSKEKYKINVIKMTLSSEIPFTVIHFNKNNQ
jgi:predicted RNase H-like nuclease (RuvC/YqgF family)